MPYLACPGCSRMLDISDSLPGKEVRCPSCAAASLVPAHRPGADETALAAPAAALAPEGAAPRPRDGSAPPGYEVLAELGRGGMGIVYKARQLKLNRLVALKVILSGAHAGADELMRFQTEAEAIARLQHPGIVGVFEIGEHEGRPFIALEYCPGGALDSKLGGTPMQPAAAAELVRALASAMNVAHEAMVVHRDLKPSNVLLGADGTPKVTDFGLAKKLDEQGQTQTGNVMGTPSYMAPEQAEGKKGIGPAADVYALGAILYECLAGRPPFLAATAFDTILQVVNEEPVPPRRLNAKVPRDLETICLKCLAKEPSRRYGSARELADELGRFLAGEPIRARPVGARERAVKWARRRPVIASLAAAVGLVGLVGLAGVLWQWRRASHHAEQQRLARLDADAARRATRRTLYAAHMNLAAQAWDDRDFSRVRELLRQHLPEAGEEDLRGWEWYRLWQNTHAEQLTLSRHDRWVRSVAWSPDGGRLATGSYDNTVRIWDAQDGRELRVLPGHRDAVHRVAFDKGGRFLASGGDDRTVRLWDLAGGRERRFDFGASVWALAFSPDGKWLAMADRGDEDGVADAYLHEVGSERTERIKGVGAGCSALAFSPSGDLVAFGCRDAWLVFYDVKARRTTPIPFGDVFGPDGDILSVGFAPDGKTLAMGGREGAVWLWDLRGKQPEPAGKRLQAGSVYGVEFSHDGKWLASASWDHKVALWPQRPAGPPTVLLGHVEAVKYAAFHPGDSSRLATASRDGSVRLWQLPVRQGAQAVPADQVSAPPLAEAMLVRRNGGTRCLGVDGEVREMADLPAGAPAAISADGRFLTLAKGGGVRLVERASGAEVAARPRCHGKVIDLVGLSADGRMVLTGCAEEKAVRVWERVGEALQPVGEGLSGVSAVSALFDPAGTQVALRVLTRSEGMVPEARLWEPRHGAARSLEGWGGKTEAVAFSPDGKTLAVGGESVRGDHVSGVARLWDVSTARPLSGALHAPLGIRSLAFSPDGRTLAAGDMAGNVKLWSANGEEKGTIRAAAGGAAVELLCFGRDGRTLATFGKGGLALHPSCDDRDVRAYLERACKANPEDAPLQSDLRRVSP